jgi:hypothetical protein
MDQSKTVPLPAMRQELGATGRPSTVLRQVQELLVEPTAQEEGGSLTHWTERLTLFLFGFTLGVVITAILFRYGVLK